MTKPVSQMTDQEIRDTVREIILRYPERPTQAQLADMRSFIAPYIAEAKVRITKQTGHKFRTPTYASKPVEDFVKAWGPRGK